jgi:hypothetical protein
MTRKKSTGYLFAVAMSFLFLVGQIFAQAGQGTITGVVTDPNGAIIPNATVRIVNIAKGGEITTTASGAGIYSVTSLEPGRYRVSASGGGFGEQTLNVEVQVGRATDANFTLGIEDVAAEVTVTAEGVQTTQSNSDAVLSETAINNLPINGRRFQDFATLTPTAQIDTERNQISLSGQRGINANINVDGVDYNQPFFGGIRGGERSNFAPTIPQESIKEFQVVAAGYNAEYGRSSGGIINVVTKSGSNSVRGSAFYLIRPDKFSRNHKFVKRLEQVNNLDITAAPTQQQFGGSIGGPIVRNRLFYFGSYEQQKFSADRFVLFSGLDSIPVNSSNQQAISYFRSQETEYKLTNDAQTLLGRMDWNVNSNHSANFRFSWNSGKGLNSVSVGDAGTLFNPVSNSALSNEGTERDKNYVFVSQLTSIFGAGYVNDFRFQYARGERPREANALTPLVNVANVGLYGTRSFLPTTQFDNRIQFVDGLSILKGNHSIKIGGEFSDIYTAQNFGFNQFGSYTFSGGGPAALQNLTLDPTNPNDRRFDGNTFYTQQIGNLEAAFRIRELAFYGQDAWRITPRFSMNFGVRLEKQFNPEPQLGNTDIINIVKNASFPLFGNRGYDPSVIPDSEWQIGPRLGFAWDTEGNGKSVLRGFAGMYYARTPALLLAGPVNNFRIPPGDVTIQLPFTTTQLSANTAGGVAAYNAFLAANPSYVTFMGTFGIGCPQVVNPGDPRACVPNTVFRQFALVGVNANAATLDNLPSLSAGQMQQIAGILGLGISPGIGANLIGMDPNYKNPRSFQFGFGYEREIAPGLVIGLDYSWVKTTHLQRNHDVNLPVPVNLEDYLRANNSAAVFAAISPSVYNANRPYFGVSRGTGIPTTVSVNNVNMTVNAPLRSRPAPQIGRLLIRESTANSLFQSGSFRMRYNRRWANINLYYTVSKSMSDDDNERNATGLFYENSYDFTREWSPARLDRRHQFVANPVFFLPLGFEVSGAIRLRSAAPIDVVVGSDLNGDTNNLERPYLVPGFSAGRNAYRDKAEYSWDIRGQKGFTFAERRRLIFSAEVFNLFNHANIQIAGTQRNYCSSTSDRACGMNGITNPNFLAVRDSSGNLITSNFSRTPVLSMQFGVRLQF